MARISGLARDLEVVTRWRKLAEQRLEHLNELYETGRWKRYHTEQAFVDNIRDAKRAVEAWRALAKPDGGMAPDMILTPRPKPIAFNLGSNPLFDQPARATLLPAEPIVATPKAPKVDHTHAASASVSLLSASLLPHASLGER